MSTQVHPTALVDPTAELADGVVIGPFCVVEAGARLGAGTELEASVVVKSGTVIGERCHLFVGAVIGHQPQDARYKGDGSKVIIGNDNVLREYTTIHRATMPGADTVLGDGNMLMAYVHVGHDCRLANRIYVASYVGVSGHVTIEDNVNIGGMTGFHQFVHVGKLAMVGGMTKVNRDVPPFMMADGHPMRFVGTNHVGLKRAGLPPAECAALKRCYKLLYRDSGFNITQALERIEQDVPRSPSVDYLVHFLRRIPTGKSGRQDQGR